MVWEMERVELNSDKTINIIRVIDYGMQRTGLAEVGVIDIRPPRLTEAKFINKS
jgi:hypothetical protein